jgi:site-specific recombinase XerD
MKNDPTRVRVAGPLARLAPDFRRALEDAGYTGPSAANQMRLIAHLSRFLDNRSLDVDALDEGCAVQFLEERRRGGYSGHLSRKALDPFLAHLGRLGLVSALEVDRPGQPFGDLLEHYRQHLVVERGLLPSTVENYVAKARPFLASCERVGMIELSDLTSAEVVAFVASECTRRGVADAKNVITALRSLLRFLHVSGVTTRSLTGAVPAVAQRRGASLPRAVEPETVQRLLESCDRGTVTGRRDFAVLVLLARLGLRAGEVAAAQLGDVDWHRGEIVVRGKGNRLEALPLPTDVGEAIADYLCGGRPKLGDGPLFFRVHAPLLALSRGGVKTIVQASCTRVGVAAFGPHRLRHSAATEMLRHGSGLAEIAMVLRHRSLDATQIYAKVDYQALSELALPWPGGAA